jgi:hypothetical protein
MYLRFAIDFQNSNLSVFAEFGGSMGLFFNFCVDFLSSLGKPPVVHDFFRVFGLKESFPLREFLSQYGDTQAFGARDDSHIREGPLNFRNSKR